MSTQTVLITGCSSGIGEATARAFLEEGWRVYATARDVGDITALGEAGCETAALDVTDRSAIDTAVDRVIEGAGRIDCVVNNAGYGQFGALEDLDTDDIHRQFDVNVYGPHRLCRAALPHMRERGDGTIVNLSSVLGRVSAPTAGAYAGSKAALESMSDALRAEVEPFGIDVVVIQPAVVATGFRDRLRAELEDGVDRSPEYGPLYAALADAERVSGVVAAPPEAVAAAVLDAASCTDPAARYTVGPLARAALLSRYLPDRWRDAVFRWARRLAT